MSGLVEPLLVVAMRSVSDVPNVPGSTRVPCACCAALVWLSPASMAKCAEVETTVICAPCTVREGVEISEVVTNAAQQAEVLAGTGKTMQEAIAPFGLPVVDIDASVTS